MRAIKQKSGWIKNLKSFFKEQLDKLGVEKTDTDKIKQAIAIETYRLNRRKIGSGKSLIRRQNIAARIVHLKKKLEEAA